MKKTIWLLAIVLSLCSWSNIVHGQTADGSTPADESVCDIAGLTGASWGLCNAYCEAMDCDSDLPKASKEACSKVAYQFAEKTAGDILPCEQPMVTDTDGDTVPDNIDNCVDVPNTSQDDLDGNGIGDACECPCWSSESLHDTVVRMLDRGWVLNLCNTTTDITSTSTIATFWDQGTPNAKLQVSAIDPTQAGISGYCEMATIHAAIQYTETETKITSGETTADQGDACLNDVITMCADLGYY